MSTTEADQVSEFDAAFREVASRRSGQEPPAASEPPKEDSVEATAKPEESVEKPPEPAPKPAEPDLQKQLADALHRERSSANRISAFARQNEELRRQLSDLSDKLNKSAAPAAPQSHEPDMLDQTPDLEAAVKRRVKELIDPVMKTIDEVAKRAGAADEKATKVIEVVEPIRQTDKQRQFNETYAELDKQLGTKWREDMPSVQEWASKDPDTHKQFSSATTPIQCLRLLRNFYAEQGQAMPTPAKPEPEAPAKPASPNTERLRMATGIPSRSTVTPAMSAADEFSATFRQVVAARRARTN